MKELIYNDAHESNLICVGVIAQETDHISAVHPRAHNAQPAVEPSTKKAYNIGMGHVTPNNDLATERLRTDPVSGRLSTGWRMLTRTMRSSATFERSCLTATSSEDDSTAPLKTLESAVWNLGADSMRHWDRRLSHPDGSIALSKHNRASSRNASARSPCERDLTSCGDV